MTEAVKTEATQKTIRDFDTPRGAISATLCHPVQAPEGFPFMDFLYDGQMLKVPAGTAFLVKGGDHWWLAQFFEPGHITGPLFFTETQIEDPRDALERTTRITKFLLGTLWAFGAFLVVGIAFLATGFQHETYFAAIGTAGTVFLSIAGAIAAATNRAWRARIFGGQHAINYMKAKDGSARQTVPLPEEDPASKEGTAEEDVSAPEAADQPIDGLEDEEKRSA